MIPKLVHHKQRVLDLISDDQDPNDRHIKEWTDSSVQPKRLLRDMQREGYIKIAYEWHGKTCKRKLIKLVDSIIDETN
jgi:hypothetical protein